MSDFFYNLMNLISGALILEPKVFEGVYTGAYSNALVLTVLFLTALSQTLGQSMVLLLNQVPPFRFILSVLIAAVSFMVGIFVWAVIIRLISQFLFDFHHSFTDVFYGVAFGQTPLIFSFLVLMPYFGIFVHHVLRVWTLLAVTVALSVFDLQIWQVLISTFIGWALIELFYLTMGRPISVISNWLWYLQTGKHHKITLQELGDMLMQGERYVR